ncbi:MAG: 3-keto-disaccharide hydrolase [Fimbriimonas sp.]
MIFLPLIATVAGWTPLWDGKTLNGFHQLGGKATYAVENGTIVGRTVLGTPNSFLVTDRPYGDFELEYEVKVDPALNSGVQIRSASVPGYRNGVVHGYQVEIDPSNRAWSGGIYDEERRGWLQDNTKNSEAAKNAFRNHQWNKYRVVAKGDHLQTWVNGIKIADLHDAVSRSGFIGLQVHSHFREGAEVRWRNLRIKDNGIPGANPPRGGKWLLRNEGDLKNWTSERTPGAPAPWTWMGDCLEIKPGSGDLISRDKYTDMQLHVEFMTEENGKEGQANGNSGVYIMQSYEVQILNSAPRGPKDNECGGIYTVKAPDYAMALPAGQWQTYDIDFTAPKWEGSKKVADARITVYHNGVLIHKDVAIPHTTGGGVAENPSPRPFRLQDHGNRNRFRNIWIRAKR